MNHNGVSVGFRNRYPLGNSILGFVPCVPIAYANSKADWLDQPISFLDKHSSLRTQ